MIHIIHTTGIFVWIWMMIIPLQKTKKHLVEKKNMEMDETPLERLFPWPRINGDIFSRGSRTKLTRTLLPPAPTPLVAPNAKEGTSIRRNALWASSHGGYSIPPQWTWWKEVSAKHPSTSFLSFCLKIIMCKVSKSKLATICKKVKCWTRKHLKIFTIFLHLFAPFR